MAQLDFGEFFIGLSGRQAQDVLEQRNDVETSGPGKLKLRLEDFWIKKTPGQHKPKP